MAVTLTTNTKLELGGTKREVWGTLDLDNSYPTGGEAIAITGMERIQSLSAQPTGGYVFRWDKANQKLVAFYGDNNNAADGPLIEVPNTTDLSAVTGVTFTAKGS